MSTWTHPLDAQGPEPAITAVARFKIVHRMNARFLPIAEVFSHRNYALFMVGLGPHAISSWMFRVAVGWLAWELTHSPAWLGIIAAADLIPVLILSPLAGVVTDRIVPVRLLRLTQWAQFVQCGAIIAALQAEVMAIELLLVLTLALGIVQAFGTAARHATVPHTVPRHLVATAVSLDSALFQTSRFIGPAIAALVIPLWGVIGALIAHLAGTFVFSVMMHFMHVPPPERRGVRGNFYSDIGDGIAYVRAHRGIGPLLLMLLAASICLRPLQEMLPGFAGAVFNSGAEGLAWLSSAMGAGAMISAVSVALQSRLSGLTNIAFAGLFGLVVATLGIVATDILWVGVIFCALSGFTMNLISVSVQALVQSAVDDGMRARVMSLYTLIFRGTPALGALVFGVLAEFLGLRWSYAVAAMLCLTAAIWLSPRKASISEALESASPVNASRAADTSVRK